MALFSWLKKKEEPKATSGVQNAGSGKKPQPKPVQKATPKPASKASKPVKTVKTTKPVPRPTSKPVAKPAKVVAKPTPKAEVKAKPVPKAEAKAEPRAQNSAAVPRSPTTASKPAPGVQIPVARLSNAEIRERMERGWLKVLITFELAGKPKEHIEATLKAYVENVKNEPRTAALSEEFAEAIEHEDGVWSAFCEMEALVMNLETLTWIAINFMPASIEVLEPEKPEIESRDVTAWLNDLLSKLHETSALVRQERGVRDGMTASLNALIKNALLACLKSGAKTGAELESLLGISLAQLEPFLQHFIEKGKVVKDGETYTLAQ